MFVFSLLQVLKKIRDILPSAPRVTTFVVDFEAGLWLDLKHVFPDLRIQGCVFHWTQAVWRKLQSLGIYYMFLCKKKKKIWWKVYRKTQNLVW